MKNNTFSRFNYIYTKWILLGLSIIAVAIRYFAAQDASLAFEEQLLWFIGSQSNVVDAILLTNQLKPFSLILGWTTWMSNFNGVYIEYINRSISLFAGVLSIPLMFFLVRKFYSEIEGLIVAAFIAVSWSCINTSITLSEHSLLLALTIFYFISLITYLDAIAEDNIAQKNEKILLIISGYLLALSSIWGILVVGLSFFYAFFFITKINTFLHVLKNFAITLIPVALLVLLEINQPIVYTIKSQNALTYINSIDYILSNNYLLSFITIASLLYLAFIYLSRLFNKSEYGEDAKTTFHNSTLIVTIWFASNLSAFILLSFFLNIKFTANDLIFILPALIMLIVRALVLITTKLRSRVIIGAAFIALTALSTTFNWEQITSKPEYNQVFRYIAKTSPKEFNYGICFTGLRYPAFNVKSNSYYMQKNKIRKPAFSFDGKSNNIEKVIKQAAVKNLKFLWYVSDNSLNNKVILKKLKQEDRIIEGFRYRGITLYKIKI